MSTPVAFFDVDGTLTTVHLWQAYMAYFRRHGLRQWTHRAFWAWHMLQYPFYRLGWLSETRFRRSWAAHLAWYVRDMPLDHAEAIWDWVVEVYLPPYWRAETRRRLEEHLAQGHQVVLVSAAPLPLIQRVARHLGVPHAVATAFEHRKGRYTGRVVPPVCIGPEKPRLAFRYLQERGIPFHPQEAWAYADALSDLELLTSVGHPVVVGEDPQLRHLAQTRSWEVL